MKVLFITYADFNNLKSGSAVRPYKIYQAFIELGHEVLLVQGNRKTRYSLYKEFKSNGMLDNVEYCYIEPSTYPIHPLDYFMFMEIRMKKIPIGIFYRDMHHKFPKLFIRKGIRKYILRLRYAMDWLLFRLVAKVIFFPSVTMAEWFRFSRKAILPPAGENKGQVEEKSINKQAIYVGGVNERYGTDLMLSAFKKVNQQGLSIRLILVCRESEKSYIGEYLHEPWLNVVHATSEELDKYYKQADVGVLPLRKNTYNDLAISVKLYEYLSNGLAIMTTNCNEMSKIVQDYSVGIVVQDDEEDMARGIEAIYTDSDRLRQFQTNAKDAIEEENSWKHRAQTLEKILLS